MKRWLSLAIAIALLLLPAALADNMVVVNCDEWVSLRAQPSTSSERLAKVPLYGIVTDCEWYDGKFTRCSYDGVTGYILNDYLEPMEPDEPDGPEVILEYWLGGMEIEVSRYYDDRGEWLEVRATDAGGECWSISTEPQVPTELTATDAFMGGTADDPRLMIYTTGLGLECLDPYSGDVLWTLSRQDVNLGAGLTHIVDADGTMYIAGYYGPDPVCIDMDGHVRWQANLDRDDIYWPYEMRLQGNALETVYDNGGTVSFDLTDGRVLNIEGDH